MKDRGWPRLHKWRMAAVFLLALSDCPRQARKKATSLKPDRASRAVLCNGTVPGRHSTCAARAGDH
jgi:hypothetical protein